jgi:multiple sugar transport system ATP-binding protein
MAGVILKDVCKRYGGVDAVKNLNLLCEDAEFTCLLGPSGCGKSSSLRMIAGLEEISSGEIYIGDRLANNLSPRDRNIAMIFETYALYPHLSVFDNIAFPLKIRQLTKSQIRKKVENVAEMMDMRDFLRKRVKGLGDGQRQRVSIARALVREPDVLLMDEPISHLDAKLRSRMRIEFRRLNKDTGTTCIYVTHDQMEAMALGDKIAIMNHGFLQQEGTPDEVFNRPANEFVAGFIGEPPMNFLNCTFVQEKGHYLLVSSSFNIPCPDELSKQVGKKAGLKEIRIGIRPTDIVISRQRSAAGSISGDVYTVEPRGDEIVLTVKLGKEVIRVESVEEFDFKPGDTIWLTPEKDRIHAFDIASGQSLI